MSAPIQESISADANLASAAPLPEEQARRSAIYSLLGALLRGVPDEPTLAYVRELGTKTSDNRTNLAVALDGLALAARHSAETSLRDEFHALFIGLGRGELVPYGSWYQTGFLMEKPLGLLRQDLHRLGFERDESVREPEDHIAALCEVMAMLVLDQTDQAQQTAFYNAHVGSWAPGFFDDLAQAESAVFYKSVGRLGQAFMALESRYLSLRD